MRWRHTEVSQENGNHRPWKSNCICASYQQGSKLLIIQGLGFALVGGRKVGGVRTVADTGSMRIDLCGSFDPSSIVSTVL